MPDCWRAVYPTPGEDLLELVLGERVTRLGLVGSVLRETVDRILTNHGPDPHLHVLTHAGAPTSAATFRRAVEAFPNSAVADFYGSTEAL
jgi:acyl-CoA synthetase (AMP-forming)/AMP-acid ligase II